MPNLREAPFGSLTDLLKVVPLPSARPSAPASGRRPPAANGNAMKPANHGRNSAPRKKVDLVLEGKGIKPSSNHEAEVLEQPLSLAESQDVLAIARMLAEESHLCDDLQIFEVIDPEYCNASPALAYAPPTNQAHRAPTHTSALFQIVTRIQRTRVKLCPQLWLLVMPMSKLPFLAYFVE
jgi:hypothetical protein